MLYEINFEKEQQALRIFFEKDFPYRIQKWSETYSGIFQKGPKTLTTSAVRTHTIQTAYWRHHGNRDRELLNKLGLGTSELGGT